MQEQGFEARSETLHSEFPHDTLKLLKDHFELVCGASKWRWGLAAIKSNSKKGYCTLYLSLAILILKRTIWNLGISYKDERREMGNGDSSPITSFSGHWIKYMYLFIYFFAMCIQLNQITGKPR